MQKPDYLSELQWAEALSMLENESELVPEYMIADMGIDYVNAILLLNLFHAHNLVRMMILVYVDGRSVPAETRQMDEGFPKLPHRFRSLGVTVKDEARLTYRIVARVVGVKVAETLN